jgi:hypothetical protein
MSATPGRPISHGPSDRARPEPDSLEDPGSGAGRHSESFLKRHRRALLVLLVATAAVGFVYYVFPKIVGLGPTLRRLEEGNPWWLWLGVLVEMLSIGGEVVLLRGVFSRPASRIGWQASYEITLAGGVATKLFATAGAGGVTLTVWALHAAGLGEE